MGVHYLLIFRRTRGGESGISGTGGTIVGGRSCQIWIIGASLDSALSLTDDHSYYVAHTRVFVPSLCRASLALEIAL